MNRIDPTDFTIPEPFLRQTEKPKRKRFETTLAEAMEKQRRIREDFDRLKARQAVRTDDIYGDGGFQWK